MQADSTRLLELGAKMMTLADLTGIVTTGSHTNIHTHTHTYDIHESVTL